VIGWLLRRCVRLFLLLFRLPFMASAELNDRFSGRDTLLLRFRGEVADHAHGPPFQSWLPGHIERLSLGEALTSIEEAERDEQIKTIALQLDRPQLALIQAEQLLAALARARAAGKRVIAWIDGSSAPVLLLSAVAETVSVTPTGDLEFLGLRVRALFLRGLFDQAGVLPELQHHGDYKTASDMFTHTSMSEAHREMADSLGADLYDQIVGPLVVSRGLTRERLDDLIDQAPLSNERAVASELFHALGYRDKLEKEAGHLGAVEGDPETIEPQRLLARRKRRRRLEAAVRDRPVVAVLTLKGAITSGDEGSGIASLPAIEAIEKLIAAKSIKAVVLRIDSPGGSALASDDIWRAIRRLDKEKPVVASMGRVAASGGYYIAAGARAIVAHAGTLTGSIGVVSGKLSMGPLLHRLGVGMEGVSFGARAGIYDPDRPFSDDERQAAYAELMRIYRVFVDRVAKGRQRTPEEIDALAQGRVYTGRQALEHGLVDRLGGMREAIEEATRLAELEEEPWIVRRKPAKQGWQALTSRDAARVTDQALLRLAPLAGIQPDQAQALLELGPAVLGGRDRVLAWCPWSVPGI
jgi:protease-4